MIDKHAIIDRLYEANRTGDRDTLREIYTPETTLWHNIDEVVTDVERMIKVSSWIARNTSGREYFDIRRQDLSDGRVTQQHVMRGVSPTGPFEIHQVMVYTFDDEGHIIRIDDYLDSVQAKQLTG
jgi:ketosteroid isomerase-like protein